MKDLEPTVRGLFCYNFTKQKGILQDALGLCFSISCLSACKV